MVSDRAANDLDPVIHDAHGDAADPVAPPVDDLEAQLAHAEDQWRRAAADLANIQNRFQRELTRGQASERERALGPLATVIDDLERALEHAESDGDGFVEGVRSIAASAALAIESEGYSRFGAPGDAFDPELHDVVGTTPATESTPANSIVAVVKAGYGTADRLLRPAAVIVAKGGEE